VNILRVEFIVNNIPPKKDGANSMWRKEVEVPRIIALREKALQSIKEKNQKCIINSYVRLELSLYLPEHQIESIGDLDNFITGVCDSFQAAHPSVVPHSAFEESGMEEIHPRHPILFNNDAKIISIYANKRVLVKD
jgi:hypothetical protein